MKCFRNLTLKRKINKNKKNKYMKIWSEKLLPTGVARTLDKIGEFAELGIM